MPTRPRGRGRGLCGAGCESQGAVIARNGTALMLRDGRKLSPKSTDARPLTDRSGIGQDLPAGQFIK